MDISTILGLTLGIGLILSAIAMGSGGVMPFIDVGSIMITIGGSIAGIMINFPLKNVIGVFSILKKCFLIKLPTPVAAIAELKELATIARRDGLLSLESKLGEIDDIFMKRGLEMVISGTSKEDLQSVLEVEVSYVEQRHSSGKKIIDSLGAAAPAFGMIGTLIGLVQMLRTLDDPSKIGGGMATALLTTLYGAVIANLFCIPLAGKLEARNKEEVMIRELMISGLIALVEGQPPRGLEERLLAFLSPRSRPQSEAA